MRPLLLLAIFSGLVSWQPVAQEKPAARPRDSATPGPAYGVKLHIAGIHNAGKINDLLYRGAQPKPTALAELKNLGITMIVDLRRHRQTADEERREAARLGLRFVYIPVGGWEPPSEEQVEQFLELFREDPQPRIFLHCRFGDDRTGVFVAIYRMAVDHWTPQQAIAEMHFFGFNGFWHRSMKKFVEQFPEHGRAPPALRAPLHASPHSRPELSGGLRPRETCISPRCS